jgi:hypothetical protein
MAHSKIRIGSRDFVACMAELPQRSRGNRDGQCVPGHTLTIPVPPLLPGGQYLPG